MRTSVARFVKDESGATAIEYGLTGPARRIELDSLHFFAPAKNPKQRECRE